MLYIALIYNEEGPPDPAIMQAYGKFNQEMGDNGKGYIKAGDPLQPSSSATCVSLRDGKKKLRDGPFIETKEQLGGYYILDCPNLDDAIACASKIPSALTGTIEVRPIMKM